MLIDLRKKIRNAQFMFCSGRTGVGFKNFEFGFSLGFSNRKYYSFRRRFDIKARLDFVLT